MNKLFVKSTAALLCVALLAGCNASGKGGDSLGNSSDDKTVSSVSSQDKSSSEVSDNVPANTVTVEGQTLGMEKLSNARQLGGYITTDGLKVKDNVLLRTGKLGDCTEADIEKLRDVYHVTDIIDMRATTEIKDNPDPDIEGAENTHVIIIDESGNAAASSAGVFTGANGDYGKYMLELYRSGGLNENVYVDMFDSEAGIAGFRSFVDMLLNHDDGAILWHCTSGKDRTGVGAVIILTLLGVDKETALQDFELTNQFNAKTIAYMTSLASKLTDDQSEIDGVAALAGVSRPFMEKLFDKAEAENGSMLEFLKVKLNITDEEIAVLKSKYLENLL